MDRKDRQLNEAQLLKAQAAEKLGGSDDLYNREVVAP